MPKQRRSTFNYFSVSSYLEYTEWVVYLSEDPKAKPYELLSRENLMLINHFSLNKKSKPFRVKVTPSLQHLVNELLRLDTIVKFSKEQNKWLNDSVLHLRWLKVITDQRIPIICHTIFRCKNVFLYLLNLNPSSVCDGLDEETPLNFALRHMFFWYYSQMLKKLLLPYEDVKKYINKDEMRYRMYYPAYKAIRDSNVLSIITYNYNDKHLLFLLKMLWKCESVNQKRKKPIDDGDFYLKFFLKTDSAKIMSFLVKKQLLPLNDYKNVTLILNHCILHSQMDCMKMILFQMKHNGLCLSEPFCPISLEDEKPLLFAIKTGDYHAIRILLDSEVVDIHSQTHYSALMYAISRRCHIGIIRLLIDRGSDINYYYVTGMCLTDGADFAFRYCHTALQIAALYGNFYVIEMLFRETEVVDENNNALSKFVYYLRENNFSEDEVAKRITWWKSLKSLHTVDAVLLCSSHVISTQEKQEHQEEKVFSNFIYSCPGTFEICVETILEMI